MHLFNALSKLILPLAVLAVPYPTESQPSDEDITQSRNFTIRSHAVDSAQPTFDNLYLGPYYIYPAFNYATLLPKTDSNPGIVGFLNGTRRELRDDQGDLLFLGGAGVYGFIIDTVNATYSPVEINAGIGTKVDFPHDPVEDGLASSIGRYGEGALVHTSDASHRASDTDELGTLGLLQQRKNGLEEEQGCEAINDDMFLKDDGVDGGDGAPVITDAGVSDNEVKLIDALGLDGLNGCGGVGLALIVELDNNNLAGGIFGDGGELLRGGVVGITDASNNDSIRAREIDVNKAGTDA
ncbi:MAG: hypothetical protein Q9193_001889, partial [Seirophora villosa]